MAVNQIDKNEGHGRIYYLKAISVYLKEELDSKKLIKGDILLEQYHQD